METKRNTAGDGLGRIAAEKHVLEIGTLTHHQSELRLRKVLRLVDVHAAAGVRACLSV